MRLFSHISIAILVFALVSVSPVHSQEKAGTTLLNAFAAAFKTKQTNSKNYHEAKKDGYPAVVSSDSTYSTYRGNVARPTTQTGKMLKPFNASSSFSSNGQVLYKHDNTVFQEPNRLPAIDPNFAPELPPLPDLRTSAQVSKVERKRAKLQQRFNQRRLREAILRAQ